MKDEFDKRTIDMFDDDYKWNTPVTLTDFSPHIGTSVSSTVNEVKEYVAKYPIIRER